MKSIVFLAFLVFAFTSCADQPNQTSTSASDSTVTTESNSTSLGTDTSMRSGTDTSMRSGTDTSGADTSGVGPGAGRPRRDTLQ